MFNGILKVISVFNEIFNFDGVKKKEIIKIIF